MDSQQTSELRVDGLIVLDAPDEVVSKNELFRLRRELELREIESQVLRSSHSEYQRQLDLLYEQLETAKEAEHHLSRILRKINSSFIGPIARRKSGFREMVERWP